MFHHGWPLTADDWDTQMLYFVSHGYRVVAHDRRGHGRSSQVGDGHDMDQDSMLLSAKLLRKGTLKIYKNFPHGMCTTHPDVVNADLLAFVKS